MNISRFSLLYFILFTLITFSSTGHTRGKSIFIGAPTEPQCRNCHDDLANFSMLKTNNRDRHHMIIGSIIPAINRSKAPNAIGAGNTGTPYTCLSCHVFALDAETGARWIIEPFRDCLQCHPVHRVTGMPMRGNNVHHETQTFQQRRCFVCHNRGGMGGGMRR